MDEALAYTTSLLGKRRFGASLPHNAGVSWHYVVDYMVWPNVWKEVAKEAKFKNLKPMAEWVNTQMHTSNKKAQWTSDVSGDALDKIRWKAMAKSYDWDVIQAIEKFIRATVTTKRLPLGGTIAVPPSIKTEVTRVY